MKFQYEIPGQGVSRDQLRRFSALLISQGFKVLIKHINGLKNSRTFSL